MKKSVANLTDDAVLKLRKMLTQSGLKPGAKFANEGVLAEELGISRSILREAVNRLKAIGVLESRQGVGLIVGKSDPVSLFENAFSTAAFSDMEIKELFDIRYALEIGAVDMVVRRISDEKIGRLDELAEAISSSNEKSRVDVDALELEFHKTYLEGAENAMIARMHGVIAAFFHRAVDELPDWNGNVAHKGSAWTHKAIVQALRERNPDRLRAVLSGHLGLY